MDQVAVFSDKKSGPGKNSSPMKKDPEYERRLKQLKEKYGEV